MEAKSTNGRRGGLSESSDTGHYHTCPSTSTSREGERRVRSSNEEKQSLKPYTRCAVRDTIRFYLRGSAPIRFYGLLGGVLDRTRANRTERVPCSPIRVAPSGQRMIDLDHL